MGVYSNIYIPQKGKRKRVAPWFFESCDLSGMCDESRCLLRDLTEGSILAWFHRSGQVALGTVEEGRRWETEGRRRAGSGFESGFGFGFGFMEVGIWSVLFSWRHTVDNVPSVHASKRTSKPTYLWRMRLGRDELLAWINTVAFLSGNTCIKLSILGSRIRDCLPKYF